MGQSGRVDAEPVRRHVQTLLDAGMTHPQIAVAAGFDIGARTILRNLMVGQRPKQGPAKTLRPATAQALMSVRPQCWSGGVGITVDSTGARRRYQALAAIGWTSDELVRRTGVVNLHTCMKRARIRSVTADAMKRVYDELHMTNGPSTTAAMMALRKGWLPPKWWDADTIDDPSHVPPTQLLSGRDTVWFDFAKPYPQQNRSLALSWRWSAERIAEMTNQPRRYVLRDINERKHHANA